MKFWIKKEIVLKNPVSNGFIRIQRFPRDLTDLVIYDMPNLNFNQFVYNLIDCDIDSLVDLNNELFNYSLPLLKTNTHNI